MTWNSAREFANLRLNKIFILSQELQSKTECSTQLQMDQHKLEDRVLSPGPGQLPLPFPRPGHEGGGVALSSFSSNGRLGLRPLRGGVVTDLEVPRP